METGIERVVLVSSRLTPADTERLLEGIRQIVTDPRARQLPTLVELHLGEVKGDQRHRLTFPQFGSASDWIASNQHLMWYFMVMVGISRWSGPTERQFQSRPQPVMRAMGYVFLSEGALGTEWGWADDLKVAREGILRLIRRHYGKPSEPN